MTAAIGIVAFCSLTMLGLLSTGVGTFQQSEEMTVSGAIRNQVVNDLQQAGWTALSTMNTQTDYFDDQANELPSSAGAIFQARVTPMPANSTTGVGPVPSLSLAGFTIVIDRVNAQIPAPTNITYTSYVGRS